MLQQIKFMLIGILLPPFAAVIGNFDYNSLTNGDIMYLKELFNVVYHSLSEEVNTIGHHTTCLLKSMSHSVATGASKIGHNIVKDYQYPAVCLLLILCFLWCIKLKKVVKENQKGWHENFQNILVIQRIFNEREDRINEKIEEVEDALHEKIEEIEDALHEKITEIEGVLRNIIEILDLSEDSDESEEVSL